MILLARLVIILSLLSWQYSSFGLVLCVSPHEAHGDEMNEAGQWPRGQERMHRILDHIDENCLDCSHVDLYLKDSIFARVREKICLSCPSTKFCIVHQSVYQTNDENIEQCAGYNVKIPHQCSSLQILTCAVLRL